MFLSAASICKAFDQMNVEYSENLLIIGRVRMSPRELHFGDNWVAIPVHTNVPFANTFDVVLTDFKSQGTVLTMTIDHVGAIPSPLISVLGHTVGTLFGKALSKASVSVNGDQVKVDFGGYLPIPFRDADVASVIIRDGIEITFDY